MSTKGRVVLMMIAGGYLAYQGVSLLKGAFMEKPDNYLVFMAFGAAFLIFGGSLCLLNLKRMIRHEYADPFRELEEAEQTDLKEEELEHAGQKTEEPEKEDVSCE